MKRRSDIRTMVAASIVVMTLAGAAAYAMGGGAGGGAGAGGGGGGGGGGAGAGAGAGGTYAVPLPNGGTASEAASGTSRPSTLEADLQRCREAAHGDAAATEACMAQKGYKKAQ